MTSNLIGIYLTCWYCYSRCYQFVSNKFGKISYVWWNRIFSLICSQYHLQRQMHAKVQHYFSIFLTIFFTCSFSMCLQTHAILLHFIFVELLHHWCSSLLNYEKISWPTSVHLYIPTHRMRPPHRMRPTHRM